ncbi:phosphatase PAP2 family protein [Streptomyces sp. NRRL F-5135]|uniref:phosphatase PAP2 family protein n=1 Tax=Streptomyces sp. NRRL F-5135 TaxID=1463858 RepID=UPI00068FBF77|nr:phosphatase PAP2 family protein [Streptomyces sp. NRRL F-5135]
MTGRWFDDGVYTYVTDLAHHSPGWLDSAVSAWSTYGPGLFAVLLLVAWWRARPTDSALSALALTAPLVVGTAYLVSSALKSVLREQRPCQALHAISLESCPPPGDWSLPSNHAVIAAAAAVTLLFTDRALAALAVPAALLMAGSRVWVGAHYPHDVVLGLIVGALVAWVLMSVTRRAAPLAERLHGTRLRPLVARGEPLRTEPVRGDHVGGEPLGGR